MNFLKWWMRIVGVLYLLEGTGLALMAFFVPGDFAAIWASAPAGSLDEIAVRGTLIAGLPGVLTWVLLGSLLWIYSRVPTQARVLVIVVVAWELCVWLPLDLIGFFNGFELARAISLMAIHAVIGVSGIFALRLPPP
jgi:hypothetical protein